MSNSCSNLITFYSLNDCSILKSQRKTCLVPIHTSEVAFMTIMEQQANHFSLKKCSHGYECLLLFSNQLSKQGHEEYETNMYKFLHTDSIYFMLANYIYRLQTFQFYRDTSARPRNSWNDLYGHLGARWATQWNFQHLFFSSLNAYTAWLSLTKNM